MHRILRELHEIRPINNYLEIGLGTGKRFLSYPFKNRIGIDPVTNKFDYSGHDVTIHHYKSDDAFKNNIITEGPFDVIFIDGNHNYEFVVRDFINATSILKSDGTIIFHDTFPFIDDAPELDRRPGAHDAWKVVLHIEALFPEYQFITYDKFPGFTLVWKSNTIRNPRINPVDTSEYPFLNYTDEYAEKNLELFNPNNNTQDILKLRFRS